MNNKLYKLVFGWTANILAVLLLIPQIIKSIKNKDTQSLSVFFLFLQMLSSIFWVVYSFILNEHPLIICMIIYCLESTFLFFYKIYVEYNNNNLNDN